MLRIWGIVGLSVVLLGSALALIYSTHYSRKLFMDIQQQESALEQYDTDWGKGKLELTTLAEANRVEQVAVEKLKLVMPLRENIIYIKP
jgi:cell division protein FtsL